jgi:vancomycin resistance protein VanW
MTSLEQTVLNHLAVFETPQRRALSLRFPMLKHPILVTRRTIKKIQNLRYSLARNRSVTFFSNIIARHQSVLIRTLGDSDIRLQKQKIKNLSTALEKLNGVIIKPGQVFSLWSLVGKPCAKRGYVKGMLLSDGKVVEGIGGGMCQLSNLLFWLFLHGPFEMVERHHHSRDVFPDSGRVLPFGSGATIMYNLLDLKVKNTSPKPVQLKVWLTEKHLKGQLVAPEQGESKFHIFEKNHYFIKRGNSYYRFNELWRDTLVNGTLQKTEHLLTNFAPVLYSVNEEYLIKHQFNVLDFTLYGTQNQQNRGRVEKGINSRAIPDSAREGYGTPLYGSAVS